MYNCCGEIIYNHFIFCDVCGITFARNITPTNTTYTYRTSALQIYSRSLRFSHIIEEIQGNSKGCIPITDAVKTLGNPTVKDLRKFLNNLPYKNKYYHLIPHFMKHLFNYKIRKITFLEKSLLCELFDKVEELSNGRLRYKFILRKLLHMMDIYDFDVFLPKFKCKHVRLRYRNIWNNIDLHFRASGDTH